VGLIKVGPDRAVESKARAMDVLFPYALWMLVSLIVIGSGIALLVW
jgi:hypothetical protein